MVDKSSSIFGNEISLSVQKKAQKSKEKYLKSYGKNALDTDGKKIELTSVENPILGPYFGVRNVLINNGKELAGNDSTIDGKNGIVIGTIRMGYGHYRMSTAIASVASHCGLTPYWFDLNAFDNTVTGNVVSHLNDLYSMGSRLSQKIVLFNKLYWEPLNSEGFKKLDYNAGDQKTAELFAPICEAFPQNMRFVSTHAWTAQAAIHAGMNNVVDMICDNWPMALHLAEGAMHVVQGPSSYLGYRLLRQMRGNGKISNPIPSDSIRQVGHFVDHEFVANIDNDCQSRIRRIDKKAARRILFSIGGAGAQFNLTVELIKRVYPLVKDGKAILYLNFGDHYNVKDQFDEAMRKTFDDYDKFLTEHNDNWNETQEFAKHSLEQNSESGTKAISGVHTFIHKNKYSAVYCTNLLMRSSDMLVTKPSELAFYPVPKLMIEHVGGHERWGAIRAAELGDGTYEMETLDEATQVLHLSILEDDILRLQNDSIVNNNKIGIYNGCYRLLDLFSK